MGTHKWKSTVTMFTPAPPLFDFLPLSHGFMDTTRLLSETTTGYEAISIRVGDLDRGFQHQRVIALDLLRGLLMVLQSIDHARAAYTPLEDEFESWYWLPAYSTRILLLRLLVHPCAPGFAMLMGIGISYFVRSRKAMGWTDARLLDHALVRGLVLVSLNVIQTWGVGRSLGIGDHILFDLTVLHGLGVNYFCSVAILLLSIYLYKTIVRCSSKQDHSLDAATIASEKANRVQIATMFALSFLLMAMNWFIVPLPVPGGIVEGYGWWRYMLYLPGMASFFFSMYPSLDWLGLTIYGVGMGLVMIKYKRSNYKNAKVFATLAGGWMILFLVIRLSGGFGNINPSLAGAPNSKGAFGRNPFLNGWVEFFNTIKYPPDLAYSSLFLAVNHLFLALFFLLPTGPDVSKYVAAIITNGPLLNFGQSALFFYVAHFYLYFKSAAVLGYLFPDLKTPNGRLDLNIGQFMVAWGSVLALLWLMCRYYAQFKASRDPNSIFRFF